MASKSTLSIFIDESGDLGSFSTHSPYYLFALVFHDQTNPITDIAAGLEQRLAYDGFPRHTVHVGPLIRREAGYITLTTEERQTLFKRIFYFARKCPIQYHPFVFKKKVDEQKESLILRMIEAAKLFIMGHKQLFDGYEHIIVYYDNGQHELRKILTEAFGGIISTVEWRIDAAHADYRLLQVADMLCTLELIRVKQDTTGLSKSEIQFFDRRELKKTYFKAIDSLKLDND